MDHFQHSILPAAAQAAAIALFASACGGGGGGEEEAFVPFNQPATLSTDTAPAAAGLMVDAALAGVTAASVGGVIIAAADTPATARPPGLLAVTRVVVDAVSEMRLTGALAGVGISVVPPASRPCSSGQVVAVWNDRAPVGELSAGDFGQIDFQACQERGFTLNGPVGLTVTAFDEATGLAAFALIFDGLTASAGGQSTEAVGNLDVQVVRDAATGGVGTVLSTPAQSFLSFQEPDGSVTELTDYQMQFAEFPDGDFQIPDGQGTVGFSGLGQASFEITAPFAGNGFDTNFPSAGQMLISGAGGTAIRLTVVNSTQVTLEVDEGTGSFGPPINRTWDQILAAAAAVD